MISIDLRLAPLNLFSLSMDRIAWAESCWTEPQILWKISWKKLTTLYWNDEIRQILHSPVSSFPDAARWRNFTSQGWAMWKIQRLAKSFPDGLEWLLKESIIGDLILHLLQGEITKILNSYNVLIFFKGHFLTSWKILKSPHLLKLKSRQKSEMLPLTVIANFSFASKILR